MWTDVDAEAYRRFIGQYAEPLADRFVSLVDVRPGQRVLDVGCGPGTLTTRLVDRVGAEAVAAVEPSPPFVAAARVRCPGVDVREAAAEDLPFADGSFDVVLAQLVVHFMADPGAGLREMGRVARAGGLVGACVWDHAGGDGPLAAFWDAVAEVDPGSADESELAGAGEGHLARLFRDAGLAVEADTSLSVTVRFDSFDDWWTPYTLGVGPAGQHVAGLSPADRDRLRDACAARVPDAPFDVTAAAWTVLARA